MTDHRLMTDIVISVFHSSNLDLWSESSKLRRILVKTSDAMARFKYLVILGDIRGQSEK